MTCWSTRSTVVAGGRHRDLDRIVQQLAGQLADRLGHGGREEQALALLRQVLGDDLPDRHDEAHVQHLVGLVEHEDLDAGERRRRARRCGRAGGPGVATSTSTPRASASRCGPMADAAEHGGDRDAEVLAVGAEALGDLASRVRASATAPARGSRAAAAGLRLAARRCRMGSAKAAVLPVPVWAMPSRSRPASTPGWPGSGSAWGWCSLPAPGF